MLFDITVLENTNLETSIYDYAVRVLQNRIDEAGANSVKDSKYDFRASIIIAKKIPDEEGFYVLFNSENENLIACWECIEEVEPFKYDADPDADNEAGIIWHGLFEKCGWNTRILGMSSQLSLQPKIEDFELFDDSFIEAMNDLDTRADNYMRNQTITQKMQELTGAAPIQQIPPYIYTDYLIRAVEYTQHSRNLEAWQFNKDRIRRSLKAITAENILDMETE